MKTSKEAKDGARNTYITYIQSRIYDVRASVDIRPPRGSTNECTPLRTLSRLLSFPMLLKPQAHSRTRSGRVGCCCCCCDDAGGGCGCGALLAVLGEVGALGVAGAAGVGGDGDGDAWASSLAAATAATLRVVVVDDDDDDGDDDGVPRRVDDRVIRGVKYSLMEAFRVVGTGILARRWSGRRPGGVLLLLLALVPPPPPVLPRPGVMVIVVIGRRLGVAFSSLFPVTAVAAAAVATDDGDPFRRPVST